MSLCPRLVGRAKHDNVPFDRTTHEPERITLVVHVFHVYLLRFIVKVGLRFGEGHEVHTEVFWPSSREWCFYNE